MLSVEITSMPASSSCSTSCQRFSCPAPGNVGVRELVDEHDVGAPGEHRVDVHLLELGAAVLDPPARDDLEVAELLGGARPPVGLDDADDHVGAALVAPPALVEHRERLADAGRRSQIQTKLAPRHAPSVTHRGGADGYFEPGQYSP